MRSFTPPVHGTSNVGLPAEGWTLEDSLEYEHTQVVSGLSDRLGPFASPSRAEGEALQTMRPVHA